MQLWLIENDPYRNQRFPWTLVRLETGEQVVIDFPEFSTKTSLPPFFALKNGHYYFLFGDTLVLMDPKNLEKITIPLKDFDISNAHALIVN
ncbi:hypothetical protein [Streptococcus merionis]|uniref:hypothetical protein n=1 Tax=Streptococcus merionis TaxID=400065 RepID=UPI0003A5B2FC|nr:hypothetical protein [Streptococcus merionis]